MHRELRKSIVCAIISASVVLSGLSVAQDDSSPSKGGVYKQVDPEGNVTYTDKPPSADAKAIKVPKGTEYQPPKLPEFTPSAPKQTSHNFQYDRFELTSPKNDEAIWDNTGTITASVSFEPFLQSGHSIEFLLDGVSVAKGSATSHQFVNLDRGTHQITARIVNDKDEEVESASVTVHLKRHHI